LVEGWGGGLKGEYGYVFLILHFGSPCLLRHLLAWIDSSTSSNCYQSLGDEGGKLLRAALKNLFGCSPLAAKMGPLDYRQHRVLSFPT
jgi:hypothetical protein